MDLKWGAAPSPAKGTVSLWNPIFINVIKYVSFHLQLDTAHR